PAPRRAGADPRRADRAPRPAYRAGPDGRRPRGERGPDGAPRHPPPGRPRPDGRDRPALTLVMSVRDVSPRHVPKGQRPFRTVRQPRSSRGFATPIVRSGHVRGLTPAMSAPDMARTDRT